MKHLLFCRRFSCVVHLYKMKENFMAYKKKKESPKKKFKCFNKFCTIKFIMSLKLKKKLSLFNSMYFKFTTFNSNTVIQ